MARCERRRGEGNEGGREGGREGGPGNKSGHVMMMTMVNKVMKMLLPFSWHRCSSMLSSYSSARLVYQLQRRVEPAVQPVGLQGSVSITPHIERQVWDRPRSMLDRRCADQLSMRKVSIAARAMEVGEASVAPHPRIERAMTAAFSLFCLGNRGTKSSHFLSKRTLKIMQELCTSHCPQATKTTLLLLRKHPARPNKGRNATHHLSR